MFALKVTINDQEPVIGGADDLGVVIASVTGVGTLGPLAAPKRPIGDQMFQFRLGGLSTPVDSEHLHLAWLTQQLKVGDRVVLEIIETDTASPVVYALISQHGTKRTVDDKTND